jgi:cold shock CspA family protein
MYDDERGFGFIRSDDHAADVFVHAKSLLGMSELIPGQAVEFSAIFDEGRRKYQATDVRVI